MAGNTTQLFEDLFKKKKNKNMMYGFPPQSQTKLVLRSMQDSSAAENTYCSCRTSYKSPTYMYVVGTGL